MIVSLKPTLLICSFALLFLVACKDDKKLTDPLPDTAKQTSGWVDTTFGQLSEKQRYFQHLLVEVPATFQAEVDSLASWIIAHEPGAIQLKGWEQKEVLGLKMQLDTMPILQPVFFTDYFDLLELPPYPYWQTSEKNRDTTWQRAFELGRFGMVGFQDQLVWSDSVSREWVTNWSERTGGQFITHTFSDTNVKRDYEQFVHALNENNQIVKLYLTAFDTISTDRLRMLGKFKGSFLADAAPGKANELIAGGADWVVIRLDVENVDALFKEWRPDEVGKEAFEASTKRILEQKNRWNKSDHPEPVEDWVAYTRLNLMANSTVLLNNENNLLPLGSGATIYGPDQIKVNRFLREQNKLRWRKKVVDEENLGAICATKGIKVIQVSDTASLALLDSLNNVTEEDQLVVCFSDTRQYGRLKQVPNLVYYVKDENDKDLDGLWAQLYGQLPIDGNLAVSDEIIEGEPVEKQALAVMAPEFCGLSPDTLHKITYAVNAAIGGRAFPGCQVVAAKNGCIVYNKSFGHQTYDRTRAITENTLYDVASLTKIVATTLVGMKLYEMEAYQLDDSLQLYLPDSLSDHLPYPSTIRNLTFQELFVHKSGLPSGFPVLPYMQYTTEEIGRFDRYYCDVPDSVFTIEVAENFYLEKAYKDSMWLKLNQLWIDAGKPYRYSDVNMNTLYFIFKRIIDLDPEKFGLPKPDDGEGEKDYFVELLYRAFYEPLGMEYTRYQPLKEFNKNQIAPTENERYWRKQLLQGYVHDPNAALYGGVAGNAGIFSTAKELIILGEMLLRKGVYQGKRYLNAETVDLFTRAQPDSHRGLGFNKPSLNTAAFGCADSASPLTFGHTGFTGTCIWVDPVSQISFVFLANRVHPTVNNRIYQYGVRGNAHQYVYDAILR